MVCTPLIFLKQILDRQSSGSFARGGCRRGRSEIPHFCSKLLLFALSSRRTTEKRGKTKKSEEKRRKTRKKNEKTGKIPPTPSAPTPLRASQNQTSMKDFEASARPNKTRFFSLGSNAADFVLICFVSWLKSSEDLGCLSSETKQRGF